MKHSRQINRLFWRIVKSIIVLNLFGCAGIAFPLSQEVKTLQNDASTEVDFNTKKYILHAEGSRSSTALYLTGLRLAVYLQEKDQLFGEPLKLNLIKLWVINGSEVWEPSIKKESGLIGDGPGWNNVSVVVAKYQDQSNKDIYVKTESVIVRTVY